MLIFSIHALALCSLFYVAFAIMRVLAFSRRAWPAQAPTPPVTVLKPVCGMEEGLYENLRSFCEQDYPEYQVIFGVSDPDDPALAVIEKLIQALPEKDLSVVINERLIGVNRKVSNLANIYEKAKHNVLAIADSDMHVGPDYLRTVVAPFNDPQVGVVTCLYSGTARHGLASALGAAFINEWFLPSVLVALSFQPIRFCFGSTMVVRREVLEGIGGLDRLAPLLADDYMLGKLISDAGFKVHLSPYVVENTVHEPGFRDLFLHELRWAKTIFTVQPLGYSLSFVTYTIPMSLLFLAVAPSGYGVDIVAVAAILLRILMHYAARYSLGIKTPARPWLAPFRDILSFAVWGASFFYKNVHWRQHTFSIEDNGELATVESLQLNENVIP